MASNTVMVVNTPRCFYCSDTGTMTVSSEGYLRRLSGAAIQDAYPELTKGEREQILTGTHSGCWDAAYGKGK